MRMIQLHKALISVATMLSLTVMLAWTAGSAAASVTPLAPIGGDVLILSEIVDCGWVSPTEDATDPTEDATEIVCNGEGIVASAACAACATGVGLACLACGGAIILFCECLDDVRHESDGPLPDSDPDRENHGCFEGF